MADSPLLKPNWNNPIEVKAYKRQWYLTHRDITIKRSKTRRLEKKEEFNAYFVKYNELPINKVKKRVRNKTYKAIKTKLPCKMCKSIDNIEIHHTDYSDSKKYEFLCRTCHKQTHMNERIENERQI